MSVDVGILPNPLSLLQLNPELLLPELVVQLFEHIFVVPDCWHKHMTCVGVSVLVGVKVFVGVKVGVIVFCITLVVGIGVKVGVIVFCIIFVVGIGVKDGVIVGIIDVVVKLEYNLVIEASTSASSPTIRYD